MRLLDKRRVHHIVLEPWALRVFSTESMAPMPVQVVAQRHAAQLAPEQQRKQSEMILRQIERLNRMTGDFVDFSLLETGKLQLRCAIGRTNPDHAPNFLDQTGKHRSVIVRRHLPARK